MQVKWTKKAVRVKAGVQKVGAVTMQCNEVLVKDQRGLHFELPHYLDYNVIDFPSSYLHHALE